MVKVSVIVPVYNVESTLRPCLDSLTRQTLKDIEIICVNDGSTDRSMEILQEYAEKDRRIRIADQPNGGYGKAMNTGFDQACGEYMGIAEPDDILSLTMFEDLYKAAIEDDLDIVKGDYYDMIATEDPESWYLILHPLDRTRTFYDRVIDPQKEPEICKMNVHTWAGIYRISWLKENGIRHHETPGASYQDTSFFWNTLLYAKRMKLIPYPFYQYRINNPQSSYYDKSKMYALPNEYEYIMEIFARPENEGKWDIWKTWFQFKKFYSYRSNVRRISQENKKEFIDYFSGEFKKALQNGELDWDLYNEKDKEELDCLLNEPELYLEKFKRGPLTPPMDPVQLKEALKNEKARNKQLQKELDTSRKISDRLEQRVKKLETSMDYRIGKGVLGIPRVIRKPFKK